MTRVISSARGVANWRSRCSFKWIFSATRAISRESYWGMTGAVDGWRIGWVVFSASGKPYRRRACAVSRIFGVP